MDRTPGPRSRHPFPTASEHAASPHVAAEHAASEHPADPHHPAPSAAFEGRTLDRPEEDVEDQGLAFDVGTLVSRRGVLGVLGAGSVAAVLAACTTGSATTSGAGDGEGASDGGGGTGSSALTEMPGETAGPYPGDGSNGADVLETSGVERSDITTSIDSLTTAEGVPLEITMSVIDMAGGDVPMVGAAVYLWQCDAAGRYSMYSEEIEGETYLRGVQIADSSGKVTFTSIVPGCYAGRWPHLHFEVFPDAESIVDAGNAILTSQIALPEEAVSAVYARDEYAGSAENLAQLTLETDGIFSDGYEQQLAQLSGDADSGYAFSIDLPIDTTTAPEAGGMGGGGGAPGGGGEAPGGGEGPGGGGEGPGGGGQPPADGDRPAPPATGSDSGQG